MPAKEFRNLLGGLSRVIARRSTLPVLGCVRFERDPKGRVLVTGTDLDSHVTVTPNVQYAPGEPVSFLAPFRELANASKGGSTDPIRLTPVSETEILIQTALGGSPVEQKIETPPVSEFPVTPRVEGSLIPITELRRSILEAFQCVSTNPQRMILGCVCIDVSNRKGHAIVGTDGRQLYSANSFRLPLKKSLLIPTTRFLAWKGFIEDGEWKLRVWGKNPDSGWLEVTSDRWSLITKAGMGPFPNWRRVVPDENPKATRIEMTPEAMKNLRESLPRLPGNEAQDRPIRLKTEGTSLKVLARANEGVSWSAIEVRGATVTGNPLEIGLNRTFLERAAEFGLHRIEAADRMSPLRFSDGPRLLVAMPLRIVEPAIKIRMAAPVAPVPSPEPTQPKPPPTEGKTMTTPTETKTETKTEANGTALKSALEAIETVKDTLRGAITQLNGLADTLKQAQREQKIAHREVETVRATVKTLQNVKI